MTIGAVAVDDAITATKQNELITAANAAHGRAIITASGTWAVPEGVHRFEVRICGGGGGGGPYYVDSGGDGYAVSNGLAGGTSFMASTIIEGVDAGTSYNVVIGAGGAASTAYYNPGGNGGKSSFGPDTVYSNGAAGGGGGGVGGGPGANASGNGQIHLTSPYSNGSVAYGAGGRGDTGSGGTAGGPGICVIVW